MEEKLDKIIELLEFQNKILSDLLFTIDASRKKDTKGEAMNNFHNILSMFEGTPMGEALKNMTRKDG